VIVTTEDAHVSAEPRADRRPPELDPAATYVIVGGLGGFGLSVAAWLADRGARSLVLTGRRGATAEAEAGLAALRARGVRVVAESADATVREDVDRVFDRIERDLPPVKGILHAAMVLDDGLIAHLDRTRLAKVMAPKVLGAWHLHQRSLRLDLDFFVLFSSMSELVGNAGQANYVAANAFLVALANHRRGLGLPALAVDWGRLSDAGYVERNLETAQRLERIGIQGIPAARATEALGRLIRTDAAHVALLRMDWQVWARTIGGQLPPRLAGLVETTVEAAASTAEAQREMVLAAPEGERPALLVAMLREQMASVLRSSAADLDPARPLSELGLDSLMAIDLVHRIENAFGVSVPAGRVGSEVTITALAGTLLELMTGSAAKPIHAANGNGRSHAVEEAPQDCLLPFRADGDRPPLFLVHAAGGLATIYSRLVAALPAGLPLFGLQSRAVDADREEFATMEEMAGAYAQLLSRHQPEGPLHLLGFSWGGYAALATAAALEASGREVALVALLDSDPLWVDETRTGEERAREVLKQISGTLFRDLGLVQEADDSELARATDVLVDSLIDLSESERVEMVTDWVRAAGSPANGLSSERVERFIRLFVRHVAIIDGHRPREINAPVVSWRARGAVPAKTLRAVTSASFAEEYLDCAHYEMLQPPFAERIAAGLDRALLASPGGATLSVVERKPAVGERQPLQVHA
jgi:thioesterase domain-containing protein/acyl carrier protein